MFRRAGIPKWAAAGVGAAALALAVPGGVGGLLGLAGAQTQNSTFTTSWTHVTTTNRVDLEAAPAPECGVDATDPVLVDQTSTELEPTITTRETVGPATILIGDLDAGGTPYEVLAGVINVDALLTYETVVTQYFQATAAGEACAVVASVARFTG